MYKVVSELVYFLHNVFVPRTTTLRSSSKLLYSQPFAHTNTLLHSFVPKTFYAWNNLPGYITHGKTLSLKKMCGPKGLSLNQPWLYLSCNSRQLYYTIEVYGKLLEVMPNVVLIASQVVTFK